MTMMTRVMMHRCQDHQTPTQQPISFHQHTIVSLDDKQGPQDHGGGRRNDI
jgi:hypothetical protein